MANGVTVWLTGLSGAGKTTLAERLLPELENRGHRVETLDGDVVRTHLSKGLGFSREDRDENIRRIAWVASLGTRHGATMIVSAISPYEETRTEARERIGDFVEVYVKCSLDRLIERDTKGLYKRALSGEIKNFTGNNILMECISLTGKYIRSSLFAGGPQDFAKVQSTYRNALVL